MAVHIVPANDWIDHVEDDCGSCPCEPVVEWYNEFGVCYDEPLIIHNALDQRELKEWYDSSTMFSRCSAFAMFVIGAVLLLLGYGVYALGIIYIFQMTGMTIGY